jgi:hypothetical protein
VNAIVPVEPKNGFDSGFGVILSHKVDNGPFDTFNQSLVKGENPALETNTINECRREIK